MAIGRKGEGSTSSKGRGGDCADSVSSDTVCIGYTTSVFVEEIVIRKISEGNAKKIIWTIRYGLHSAYYILYKISRPSTK